MIEASAYSLTASNGPRGSNEFKCCLAANGEPLPVVINGEAINLQLTCGAHTLLATSYDYFDGCHQWLYLLDSNGKPIDALHMPDSLGFLQNLKVLSANEVSFGYFGSNDEWHVTVHADGYSSYAASKLRLRPNRFFLAKRHLAVHCIKGPPWALAETPNTGATPNPPR
jgi:hypothetical protein